MTNFISFFQFEVFCSKRKHFSKICSITLCHFGKSRLDIILDYTISWAIIFKQWTTIHPPIIATLQKEQNKINVLEPASVAEWMAHSLVNPAA